MSSRTRQDQGSSPIVQFLAIFGILAVVILAGVGIVELLDQEQNQEELPPFVPENLAEKRQEIAQAFRTKPLGNDHKENKEIQVVFQALAASIKENNPAKLGTLFDVNKMFSELENQGVLQGMNLLDQRRFFSGFRNGFETTMLRNLDAELFCNYEFMRIKLLEDNTRAIVYVKHLDANRELLGRKRWWLQKGSGRWRISDVEDLALGIRMSTFFSLAAADFQRQKAGWVASFPKLMHALQQFGAGELEKAEKELQEISSVQFPPPIEALKLFGLGAIHLGNQQAKQALVHFERAAKLHPDMPILDFLLARTHLMLGQPQPALDHARKFADLFGEDADVCDVLGQALAGMNRLEEAADAYRKGLKDNKESVENLVGLGLALPKDKMAEVATWFLKLKEPATHFETIAAEYLRENALDALEILLSAYRKIAPNAPAADYYSGQVLLRQKQYAKAAEFLKKAMTQNKDGEKKPTYVNSYLSAMVSAKKPLEAYQAVPDAVSAFKYLANCYSWQTNQEDQKVLAQLIERHRQRQPNDPWIHFYTGEIHARSKEYDKAEQAYAAGMASKTLAKEERDRFRYRRVYVRFQAGKALSAYAQIESKKAVFDQLAENLAGVKDAKTLESLVAARRKDDPKDPDLLYWDGEILWLGQKYSQVVDYWRKNRQTIIKKPGREYQVTDRMVRSLVRLRRFDEAGLQNAMGEQLKPDLLLAAMILARAEKVEETAKALEKCTKEGYQVREFYEDPDLGPALRSEKFRTLRTKYPEPKDGAKPKKPDA